MSKDDEIKTLEMQLGMTQEEVDDTGWRGTNEGSKMADNASLWNDGSLENNIQFGSSGFFAIPEGSRQLAGTFGYQNEYAYFWSSSVNESDAMCRSIYYFYTWVFRGTNDKNFGFSVRCLRD